MIITVMKKDKRSNQTQQFDIATQKTIDREGVKQILKIIEKEIKKLQTVQQPEQQLNSDLNNISA
ncbi:MAG: hypothetical protein EZS28_055216, partial [Streblomastix strix]